MLKQIIINRVTVFYGVSLRFSKCLNVIIGENGSGKSHLLKIAYSLIAAAYHPERRETPKKLCSQLQLDTTSKLIGVLRPESLGRLAQRKQGRAHSEITLTFDDERDDCSLSFATSCSEVTFDKVPQRWQPNAPVFFPTRELLTLYPNFVSFYDGHYLEYEETYRDTCVLLGAPTLRGPKTAETQKLLNEVEKALGGKVVLDRNGHFYLKMAGQGTMEMPLVAEGLRKLAMAVQLINNGSLQDKGYFFWDQLEANLNPKLIKLVARLILGLCKGGIQVFISTHSLFLIRELDYLRHQKEFKSVPQHYIGLKRDKKETIVEEADSADGLQTLTMLEEELAQTERYLEENA